jgi:hypothetical protein
MSITFKKTVYDIWKPSHGGLDMLTMGGLKMQSSTLV